jgi:hypothetical protein
MSSEVAGASYVGPELSGVRRCSVGEHMAANLKDQPRSSSQSGVALRPASTKRPLRFVFVEQLENAMTFSVRGTKHSQE